MKMIFQRLLFKYSNLKLKQKFLLLLIACIIPVVLVSFYIYVNITNRLVESQLTLAKQGYQQVESFLNYRLDRILLTTYIIAFDSNLNNILKKDTTIYTLNQQTKDINSIKAYLSQFQSANHNNDSLRLYIPNTFSYSMEEKSIFSLDSARDTLWYQNTFKGWGWLTFNPPEFVEDHNSLAVVRPIRNLEHYRHMIGAIRIDIALGEIEQMLSRINLSNGCLSYLTTIDGNLAGTSSHDLLKDLQLNTEYLNRALASNRFIKLYISGKHVWAYANYLENVNLILVTVLPEEELANEFHLIQLYYILALLFLVFFIVIIIILSLNSITRRIRLLVNRMKLVQEGNLNAFMNVKYKDEIGLLMEDFNFMLQRINELVKEQYLLGQELKTAELKALQSQINPHFLYNTLEMIGWLAQKGTPKQVQTMVHTLAQFFRLSLNRGNDVTTIANEMNLVESYLYIQCSRFQKNLNVEIDVKGIEQYSIPKITLQPIVENAIMHGILEKSSKSGTIKIKGKLDKNNMIRLSISDDGVGMTKSQIKKLKSEQHESNASASYGLKNTEMRICLYFCIDEAIRIFSKPGVGTRIIIRIPPVPYNG